MCSLTPVFFFRPLYNKHYHQVLQVLQLPFLIDKSVLDENGGQNFSPQNSLKTVRIKPGLARSILTLYPI